MDWNRDGKQDWRDDALFHTVIDRGGTEDGTPPSDGPPQKSGRFLSTVLPLLYLSLLLPGDIPINTFTILIGIFCLGILIKALIS